MFPSYRNQAINLPCKLTECFLYDWDIRFALVNNRLAALRLILSATIVLNHELEKPLEPTLSGLIFIVRGSYSNLDMASFNVNSFFPSMFFY